MSEEERQMIKDIIYGALSVLLWAFIITDAAILVAFVAVLWIGVMILTGAVHLALSMLPSEEVK